MKKICADLHLCANEGDLNHASRLTKKASMLGYRLVAIPFSPKTSEEHIQSVRDFCREAGMDFASRVDIRPQTLDELLNGLRRLRRRFEIVAVMCEHKNVARQAAKDRRVDLLNFPQYDFHRRFFDKSEAELASSCLAALEISMKPLLTLDGVARIRLLSSLRREAAIAVEFRVPIVISSGVSDELLMRKPMDMAALASLFDLDVTHAAEAVSKNPVRIVKRNLEKLDPRFIAPGIRIVRRGKDC